MGKYGLLHGVRRTFYIHEQTKFVWMFICSPCITYKYIPVCTCLNTFIGLDIVGVYEEIEKNALIMTVRGKQRRYERRLWTHPPTSILHPFSCAYRSQRTHSDANKNKHKRVLIAAHRLFIALSRIALCALLRVYDAICTKDVII